MPLEIAVCDAMLQRATQPGKSCFETLRAVGLSSFEAMIRPDGTLGYLQTEDGDTPFSIADEASLQTLKSRLKKEEVKIAALLLGTDFSGPEAEMHTAWTINAVRAAQFLGVPVVRIDTATRAAGLSTDIVRDHFVRCILSVLEETDDSGVDLGIENHGTISNDPAYLDEIFARVPDRRLGMTLDTGNFYWYGFPLSELYRVLEHFAPRARHTHVKNINYPAEIVETQREKGYEYGKYCCPLDEGNISMQRVAHILQDAGYTRTLCIENEALGKYPIGERVGILRRDADCLRAAQT